MSLESLHTAVLLEEVVGAFDKRELKIFVDGTVGAGGHALRLLQEHEEIKRYIGIDRDPVALEAARRRLDSFADKVILVRGNFADLSTHLKKLKIAKVDGVLLDFGVSSMQLDCDERGFSFLKDGPLDMRMDPSQELTAEIIVNKWPREKLEKIFREEGEEPRWRAAAKAIVEARRKKRIVSTKGLCEVLTPVLRRKRSLHPLTLVFQGLRICVNDELEGIRRALPMAMECLNSGGRLAAISFHSLEDRIVKQTFRKEALEGEGVLVTKKPLVASAGEKRKNPRSRSAKLRIFERIE